MSNDSVIVDNAGASTPVKAKKRSGRPIMQNSKERQCIALFKTLQAQNKSRKEIIAEFIAQIPTTKLSAGVYYHKARHAVKAEQAANDGSTNS